MSRPVRAWVGSGLGMIVVSAVVMLAIAQPWRDTSADEQQDDTSPATVRVERTSLTAHLQLNGTLSYGDSIDLLGRTGTVTGLPAVGTEIAVGQAIYEVDGRPVIAVRGERPFWRDLAAGIPNGPDVQQLEQFLVDAGFGADITPDEKFTWVTRQRVAEWQESLGLEGTGMVTLGDIVAINAPTVRVADVTGALGDSASQSPLSYTSTQLRVVVALTEAQARELVPTTVVTVVLPDGTEAPGSITSIDPGGQPTAEEGRTTPPTASIDFDEPDVATGIGLRAVRVLVASEEIADALVVPVNALVATLDGGYALDVLRGGELVRVPVDLGLISDARVQIVDGDVVEGDTVVIAK